MSPRLLYTVCYKNRILWTYQPIYSVDVLPVRLSIAGLYRRKPAMTGNRRITDIGHNRYIIKKNVVICTKYEKYQIKTVL